MMPRSSRSAAASMRTSFIAMRAMVSGCALRCVMTDVPAAAAAGAPVRGTTIRPVSRALLSAFSILLISEYLHQTQRGQRRRRADRSEHDQREQHQLDPETFQLRGAPQVRHGHHDRRLVHGGDLAPYADTRIELQPRDQQA